MEFSLRLSISMQQACVQLFFDFNAQRATGKQRQRPLSNLQPRCGVRLPLSHLLLRRTLLFKITAALHFNRDSRRVYDSDFFGCNCAPRTFSSHIWRLALLESFFPIVIHSLHLIRSRPKQARIHFVNYLFHTEAHFAFSHFALESGFDACFIMKLKHCTLQQMNTFQGSKRFGK